MSETLDLVHRIQKSETPKDGEVILKEWLEKHKQNC